MALIDKLTAIADGFRESNGIADKLSLDEMAVLAKQGSGGLIEDLPTTPGQWACLARASQMRDIQYQIKADMTAAYDDWQLMSPGVDYTGIIYSSVRGTEWGFIGYGISVYSYLTALNNPKSIAYTKKYPDYFPLESGQANVSNVFGTNCSEFVSYCLDLPYLKVTNDLRQLPNMERVCWNEATQSVDTTALQTEMKVCDVPLSLDVVYGHTVFVTGLRRNSNGSIMEVDISDSWPPRIRKTSYTWDEFVQKFIVTEKYTVYRYTDLDKVTFPENLTDIVYSDIVTNRGDKVCIRPDMDIALNVLGTGYAGIVLFKDGVQIRTQASTADWELSNLTTGKYTAILYKAGETVTIDDADETNSTSFIVCAVTLSRSGNTYKYTAEAVGGVYPMPMQVTLKSDTGFTHNYVTIDNDNFKGSGSVEAVPPAGVTPGIVHLPFRTEYGFVIAECGYAETPPEPEDVNLVPTAVGTDGKIYNGTGYKDGYRFKSSDPYNDVAQAGSVTTGYIPCAVGDKFVVSGVEWGTNTVIGFYTACAVYYSNYAAIEYAAISGNSEYTAYLRRNTALETGDGYVFEVLNGGEATPAYIRFSMKGNGADMVVRKLTE